MAVTLEQYSFFKFAKCELLTLKDAQGSGNCIRLVGNKHQCASNKHMSKRNYNSIIDEHTAFQPKGRLGCNKEVHN